MQFFKKKEDPKFYDVEEISATAVSKLPVVLEELSFKLCKDKNLYNAILKCNDGEEKFFSLFRIGQENDAKSMFARFNTKLALNLDVFGKECMHKEPLQKLTDAIRFHESYNLAHLAVCTGETELFKKEAVKSLINKADDETLETAVFVAVEHENVEMLKVLLEAGASLDVVNIQGNSIYHQAATCKNSEIIKILGGKDKSKVNAINKNGQTPLHEACIRDLPDNVMELLAIGANTCTSEHNTYPIHFALKNDCLRAVEMLCNAKKCQANRADKDNQDSPLHWAVSSEALCLLLKLGADLEMKNSKGETVLMRKVKDLALPVILTCLYKGANVETTDNEGNTPLMVAIMKDNCHLVKMLLMFGADVNAACTVDGVAMTPRHKAALSNGKNKDAILFSLHAAGAQRCDQSIKNCNSGCSFKGSNNGKVAKVEHPHPVHEEDLTMEAVKALWSYSDTEAMKKAEERCSKIEEEKEDKKPSPGSRILSLNSGRLEGLMVLRSLMHVQQACGKPLKECFDFVAGTGSGAFIALAIMQDRPLQEIFNCYLEVCKEVLFRSDVACTEKDFDAKLKHIFGENKKLSDCHGPKLLTTGCRLDERPVKKVLCRNYDLPGASAATKKKNDTYMKPSEVLCWRSAKWSGFAQAGLAGSSKTFMDGCMMGPDCTMDALLETHHCNIALAKKNEAVKPVHVVVCLGGECSLLDLDQSIKLEGREMLKEEERKALYGKLLLEHSEHSDAHESMKVKAWCHMLGVPLIRVHPCVPSVPKPQEVMEDPICLTSVLWECESFLKEHSSKFEKIASLLR